MCCVIFFFQAEDGIRDYKVTGVQTCALPISEAEEAARQRRDAEARERDQKVAAAVSAAEHSGAHEDALRHLNEALARSEERRVGKECRCPWRPNTAKQAGNRDANSLDKRGGL